MVPAALGTLARVATGSGRMTVSVSSRLISGSREYDYSLAEHVHIVGCAGEPAPQCVSSHGKHMRRKRAGRRRSCVDYYRKLRSRWTGYRLHHTKDGFLWNTTPCAMEFSGLSDFVCQETTFHAHGTNGYTIIFRVFVRRSIALR